PNFGRSSKLTTVTTPWPGPRPGVVGEVGAVDMIAVAEAVVKHHGGSERRSRLVKVTRWAHSEPRQGGHVGECQATKGIEMASLGELLQATFLLGFDSFLAGLAIGP